MYYTTGKEWICDVMGRNIEKPEWLAKIEAWVHYVLARSKAGRAMLLY